MLSSVSDISSLLTTSTLMNIFMFPEINFSNNSLIQLLHQAYEEFTISRVIKEAELKEINNFLFDEQLNFLVKEWNSVFEDNENLFLQKEFIVNQFLKFLSHLHAPYLSIVDEIHEHEKRAVEIREDYSFTTPIDVSEEEK